MRAFITVLVLVVMVSPCVVAVGRSQAGREEKENQVNYRDVVTSGTCDSGIVWVYEPTSATLTLSGQGPLNECMDIYNLQETTTVKKVIIQPGITEIGKDVFNSFKNMSNITIPNTVTSIGDGAFQHCDSLESITIPGSVKSIGFLAFPSCDILKTVVLEEGVKSLGNYSFFSCPMLESVTIPSSLTSIGSNAFKGCKKLSNVIFSLEAPHLESIGSLAFSQCSSLKSITLPDSVRRIEENAFTNCSTLTTLYYLGVSDPGPSLSNVFPDILFFVYVPPGYTSTKFCGKSITKCAEKSSLCYDTMSCSSNTVTRKNANATAWERQVSECFEYQCNNTCGFISRNKCGDGVCMNDKCIREDEINYERFWGVDMDVSGENITAGWKTEDIRISFSESTGIPLNSLTIVTKTNDEGQLLRIILLVEDKGASDALADAADLLYRGAVVRIIPKELQLSQSSHGVSDVALITIVAIYLLPLSLFKSH